MDSITKSLVKEKEDAIILEVKRKLGVDVDTGELLQALQYDRFQYDKGYADGHRDAMDKLVRCKDCKNCRKCVYPFSNNTFNECKVWRSMTRDNDFCSYGERREGE